MSKISDILKLSDFIDDYEGGFWGGDGKLRFQNEDLVAIVIEKPNITLGGLRDHLQKDILSIGVDLSASGDTNLTLGPNDDGLAVALDYGLDIDAWMHIVYSGSADVAGLKPGNLDALLNEYIALQGGSGLIVLTFDGAISAGAAGQSQILMPNLNVGFSLSAGGGYTWAYLMPFGKDDLVLGSMKSAFGQARLPQTIDAQNLNFKNNELLLSRYTGFLKVGAQASFGYEFTGSDITKDFSKPLDIKTKLTMQAQARLAASYQLTGAFQVIVTDVKDPERDNWVRVVIEKDRKSTFDVAFGVKVAVDFDTSDAPQALALFDAVLGTNTERVLKKAFSYASEPEEQIGELKKKIDGFTQGIVEAWVGERFEDIEDELSDFLGTLKKIRAEIQQGEEYLIGFLENISDEADIDGKLQQLIDLLESDTLSPEERRSDLLDLVDEVWFKTLLEQILDRTFGDIFTHLESLRDDAVEMLSTLHHLASGDVGEAIKKFIAAKKEALGLQGVLNEINEIESVDDLRTNASEKIKEFVSRLIDGEFDRVMKSSKAKRIFAEIKEISAHFGALLEKGNEIIKKALNAKGRFELGWAYQRQKKNQKLIDVEIDVSTDQGQALYYRAVEADFGAIFQDRNIPLIHINSAVFTETLFKQNKLNVHVFGWDFKETASMLSALETSVQVGGSGFLTMYKMTVEGKVIQETERRMTEFGFLLQIIGVANGAFEANDALKEQVVDGLALLRKMDNALTYTITDQLTSLGELESYFNLAIQMNLISRPKLARLVQSLRELRKLGMDDNNFGKVGVKYTFSFDADALANALSMDFSTEPDLADPDKSGNVYALQNLFFDRLLASYYIGPDSDLNDFPVWALFKSNINKDIETAGVGFTPNVWKSEKGQVTLVNGQKETIVRPELNDVYWAEVMYRRIVDFSKFLEKFRKAMVGDTQITLVDFGQLLNQFVKRLKGLNRRDFALRALPLLVLDEMVRRGQSNASSDLTGLLEITLYDKDQQDEAAHYIAIGGE